MPLKKRRVKRISWKSGSIKNVLVFVRNGLDIDELEEREWLCEVGGKCETVIRVSITQTLAPYLTIFTFDPYELAQKVCKQMR